jgi:hypothetical protein
MTENRGGTKVGDSITGLAVLGLFVAAIAGMVRRGDGIADPLHLFVSVVALAAILYFVQGR